MTSLEFAQYLATQPWGAEYYQNLSTQNHESTPIGRTVISGAFSWNRTPQRFFYWSELSDSINFDVDDTWSNLQATLTDYFSNHPEFLI
jgi:hypothetical protein